MKLRQDKRIHARKRCGQDNRNPRLFVPHPHHFTAIPSLIFFGGGEVEESGEGTEEMGMGIFEQKCFDKM